MVSIHCCGSDVKQSRCVLARLMCRRRSVKLSDPGVHAWRSDGGGGGGKVIVLKRESFTANRTEEFNHCKTPNSSELHQNTLWEQLLQTAVLQKQPEDAAGVLHVNSKASFSQSNGATGEKYSSNRWEY